MPNAEVAANQGALLGILAQAVGARRALEEQNAAVARENLDAASGDARVQGVRQAVADIAASPDLDATAVQTVGVKGWAGVIIARRR